MSRDTCDSMDEKNTTTTPYHAIDVFCTCMYPHIRKGIIPGLTRSYIYMEIIAVLSQGKEFCYQRNLEDIIGISHAGIANVLKDMETKGLITRKTRPDNKRDKIVSLTQKGEEVLAWHLDRIRRFEEIMYAGISEEELRAHARLTWKMSENLMDAPERVFKSMPTFEEFQREDGVKTPEVMSGENQSAFLKMIRTLKDMEQDAE